MEVCSSTEHGAPYGCSVTTTLAVIGGRWKPVILFQLLAGTKRFGELRRLVPGATERMLTLQLRELEADGIISRTVYAQVPPKVEYALTETGRTLESVLIAMRDWGAAYATSRPASSPASPTSPSATPCG